MTPWRGDCIVTGKHLIAWASCGHRGIKHDGFGRELARCRLLPSYFALFLGAGQLIQFARGTKQLPFYLELNLILTEAMDFFTASCCYNKNIMLAEAQEFAIQIYFSQLISYDGQAKLCFVSLSPKTCIFEIPYFF